MIYNFVSFCILQRSLARTISDKEARQSSPKYLSIDHIQKVIEERLSAVKFKCVEHLETSLSCNKSKKLEQTIEEKACYLTYETTKFVTIYINKKHVKQPYFALCLARTLQPILEDLNYDHSICASLIASNAPQMGNLLQLANVSTEENILSVIKQQYVPSSGKFYADDISLLTQYNAKSHDVLVGDLCVRLKEDGAYVYCKIVAIKSFRKPKDKELNYDLNESHVQNEIEYEFTVQMNENENELIRIGQRELYVLENWKRVNEAVVVDPPSEIVTLERKISTREIRLEPIAETLLNEDRVFSEHAEEKLEDTFQPEAEFSEQISVESLLTRLNSKENTQDSLTEACLWLQQAKSDLESAYNDMVTPSGKPAYEWVLYKCYRVRLFNQFVILILPLYIQGDSNFC